MAVIQKQHKYEPDPTCFPSICISTLRYIFGNTSQNMSSALLPPDDQILSFVKYSADQAYVDPILGQIPAKFQADQIHLVSPFLSKRQPGFMLLRYPTKFHSRSRVMKVIQTGDHV